MFLGFVFELVVGVVIAGALGAAVILGQYVGELPDHRQLEQYRPKIPTEILDSNSQVIASLYTEYREFTPIEDIPSLVQDAFLSAEDKNFYTHTGLDPAGILRALIHNIRAMGTGERMQGASTITQQVIKNFLLDSDRTIERKLKEAVLAMRFEEQFTKDQILELYLNQIYLGAGSYGVAAAAKVYFKKDLDQLEVHEAAYLAAMPKAPNDYHPHRQTKRALARRNWVLAQMLDNGRIARPAYEVALRKDLGVADSLDRPPQARIYYTEEVRRQLVELFGFDGIYDQGFQVKTHFDPRIQQVTERALLNGLFRFDKVGGWKGALAHFEDIEKAKDFDLGIDLPENFGYFFVTKSGKNIAALNLKDGSEAKFGKRDFEFLANPKDENVPELKTGDVVLMSRDEKGKHSLRQIPNLQGAVVVMDSNTGAVQALQGGFSFATSEFNRAVQALRQPGSSVKPFVYEAALANGFSPVSIVVDGPIVVDQGPDLGFWSPTNYSNKFYGPTPLRRGLELSRNLMTVRLAQAVGISKVTTLYEDLGLAKDIPFYYSAALGSIETTPLRLASAFATLSQYGRTVTPRTIEMVAERDGKVLVNNPDILCIDCMGRTFGVQLLDPLPAFQTVWIMRGVVQRGTGAKLAALGLPIAGKTGTSNEAKDLWFTGMTTKHVVTAYVGYDVPAQVSSRATGGGVAAPIVQEIFASLYPEGQEPEEFKAPEGIRFEQITSTDGLAAKSGRGSLSEAFKEGEGPNTSVAPTATGEQVEDGANRFSGTGGLY